MPLSYSIILTILVTGAMASDISQNRIYNIWLLPPAVTGISIRLICFISSIRTNEPVRISNIATFLASAIIIYLIYLLHGLGAGDVKLILTGSLFMTSREMIVTMAAAFIIAGIMAIMLLMDRSMSRHSGRYTLPFAVPYGLSVILLIGGILQPEML